VLWITDRLRGRPRALRLGVGGAFAVLLGLGVSRSADRQLTWKDTDAVFTTLAADAPQNFKSHYALGGRLFEQKRPVEAEREWRYAIALMPDYFGVYLDLAHKYRDAHVCQAAIPQYKEALAREPALPLGRAGLAACYLELAQWHNARRESRSAIADGFYRKAFEYMIERADSALAATDSLDPTNKWKGKATVAKP
jgi:tetratricopeptide (TPR) repeat protein